MLTGHQNVGEVVFIWEAASPKHNVAHKCCLDLNNLWGRASVFYKFNFYRIGETLPHVLLRMVRGGRFYPSGRWVIPSQGRGMVRRGLMEDVDGAGAHRSVRHRCSLL